MFRFNYSKLDLEQVRKAVLKEGGPACAGELSDWLVSREVDIHLDNEGVKPPELKYCFQSPDRLTLIENDGEPVECSYGALKLNSYVLFAHMIPDALRGYTVILDTDSGRAAAIEMWFIDYEGKVPDTSEHPLTIDDLTNLDFFINREVERQVYLGCFTESGREAVDARFFRSLRLDNKMVRWKDDLGRNRIFTYISNYFSTMVEPDTPDGGDVLTFPSDYLQLDDSAFFFDFGEAEYSGRLSVEVFDLFTMKKIGVTMGIDENDCFEFRLYRADGKYLGQYATFYDFDDPGNILPPRMAARLKNGKKGARCTYRTSLLASAPTAEQINALSSSITLFDEESNPMISESKLPYTAKCAGKKVMFRDDSGFFTELDFFAPEHLRFRTAEQDWTEAEYRAFELDADLVFLGFYIAESRPPRCMQFALDFKNGCATCIDSKMEGGYDAHDVVPEYHFGYMEKEGVPAPGTRHGFTSELLGRSFTWTYSPGMSSQHIYNAPNSYSWTIFIGGEPGDPGYRSGGFVWSSPCTYIKLRDEVYIMTWVEEKWAGGLSTAAMNLRIMHDCGFNLALSHDGQELKFTVLSAFARDAGRCDLSGIY